MTTYPKISALVALGALGSLGALIAFTALAGFAGEAVAKMPKGIVYCAKEDTSKCNAWWARRSAAQKKWFLNFAEEDRNNAAVCFQLLGFPEPNEMLNRCARNKIADRRSMAHCMGEGFEILTPELATCQTQWKRDNGYTK